MPCTRLRLRLAALSSSALIAGAVACSSSSSDAPAEPTAVTSPATDSVTPPPAPTTVPFPVDGGPGADADPPPVIEGVLSRSYVDYAINHVISTGQSNNVSNGGTPIISTTQPFGNLMFDTGVMSMSSCNGDGCNQFDAPSSFVPLVEGDKFFNYGVETASAGIANEVSHLAIARFKFGTEPGYPAKHDVLVSVDGRSGNTYWCLRKNGCSYHPDSMLRPFSQSLLEVQAAKQLATAAGQTYAVRAITAIHGESEHYAYTGNRAEFPLPGTDGTPGKIADYADALVEWQHDYETDIVAITGQKVGVPLFISQLSGWTDVRTSRITQMQLDAHLRAPGKVVLVTPSYPLSVREDCLHYDSHGQRRLGEYFAKAYARTVFSGAPWEPTRPIAVTRSGAVITVKFYVPKPPLVFDTTKVTDPGNKGFDVVDPGGALLPVSSVALASADTVVITLPAAPAGAVRLRYAQNQPATACIGPGTVYSGGARGNLRDSDDAPSQYGYDLWNWSVAFDVAVTN